VTSLDTVWQATAHPGPVLPVVREALAADVAVVGLGSAGLTAATLLAQAGMDVVAVDAGQPGTGASGRNGGFLLGGLAAAHHQIAAQLGRDRATTLYRLTLDALSAAVEEHPGVVRRIGSVRVSRSPAEDVDCAAQLAAMRADGLPVEDYEGPEGRGLLFACDAVFHPLTRTRVLAATALAAGARLYGDSPVTAVEPRVVGTAAGPITARRGVLVAVDGGLERLVPALAGRVRAARLQMLATAPAPDVALARPVYARYGLDYWQQLPDGRVALGGGRDIGGNAEWTTVARTSVPVQEHLDRLLRKDIGTSSAIEHRWAGIVGFTADHLPVLAEPAPGLFAVGGYSGTGNLVGPLCATWAAHRLLGRPDDLAELLRTG
jgi:glycine/D-amino acid oxidase-like deaminating enzyme